MKKILLISGLFVATFSMIACKDKQSTGRAYMPDMTDSKAYETYAPSADRLAESGAQYSARPVEGTIARGEMPAYAIKNDTAGYVQSATVKNPLDAASIDMKESERLYLVNCAICHGTKLDGLGPLYADGKGPFTALPKNLMSADGKKLTEGTMFHSITYGKGMMGSYASQLSTKQRWMVIAYIKSKQGPVADTSATTVDTTKTIAAK